MKRRAKLELSSQLKPWQQTAARRAKKGMGSIFRSGFRTLGIRIKKPMSSHAYTRASSVAGKLIIKFNPAKHKGSTLDRRIGRLTQTLAHEMYLHARRDLRAQRKGIAASSAESDHGRMHSPGHRDGFLSASRRTFKTLANAEQKRAFAKSWFKDMKNEIEDADGLSAPEQTQRVQWARERRNSMIDAITNPDDHEW